MSALEEKPIPWRELLEALFRRRWTIVSITVAGFLVASILVTTKAPTYTAVARIQLTAEGFSGPREEAMDFDQIQAELAFLKSPVLIRSVLREYSDTSAAKGQRNLSLRYLVNSPKRLANDLYRRLHGMPQAEPLDSFAHEMAEWIEAEPVGRSNVIEISYQDSNPEFAARFVNDLIAAHTERIATLEGETETLPFWDAKIQEAAKRSSEAQAALDAYEAEQGPDLLARDEAQLKTVLAKLEADRIALETRVFEAQAQISFLSDELVSQPETIEEEVKVSESELAKLIEEQILELEIERTELLTRYTPRSTPVRQLDRQIESLQNRLETTDTQRLAETTTGPNPARQQVELDLMRARGDLTATRARLVAMNTQLEVYRDRLKTLQRSSAEFERLMNEGESASEAHQNYLRQAEAARFDRSLGASKLVNVSLIDRAEVPGAPERSYRRRRVVQGTLIGFIVGLLVAFGRDWLDPTVKGSHQAARLTGLAVISELPP
ncbi:MAG: Wzz/FepE/Etk N-terminal domain-containing protein [Thermoanaerobaculia bacterium]